MTTSTFTTGTFWAGHLKPTTLAACIDDLAEAQANGIADGHDRAALASLREIGKGLCGELPPSCEAEADALRAHNAQLRAALEAAAHWLEHPAVHDTFRPDTMLYRQLSETAKQARAAITSAVPL
jgi:hypothetical protein